MLHALGKVSFSWFYVFVAYIHWEVSNKTCNPKIKGCHEFEYIRLLLRNVYTFTWFIVFIKSLHSCTWMNRRSTTTKQTILWTYNMNVGSTIWCLLYTNIRQTFKNIHFSSMNLMINWHQQHQWQTLLVF